MDDHLKEINEELYKRNLELAVRNKTLSLLRELYEISIQTLGPKDLSGKLTQAIRDIMQFDFVAIVRYDATADKLFYLNSALSAPIDEALKTNNYSLDNLAIEHATEHPFYRRVVVDKQMVHSETVGDILPAPLNSEILKHIQDQISIKTRVAFPLIIESQVTGVLLLGLNRLFEELSQFEQESVLTIVNVVSVALDRSTIYNQLKVANSKLKDLDRQKTEFLSIASHQLRAPLTAIKGYSSLLLEGSFGELTDKIRGAADVIFQSSQKLTLVVEDFLNVSRIELGKMKYELSDFSLKSMAELIIKEFTPTVEGKGLKLSFNVEPHDDEFKIHGDYGKLSQVMANLVDNAFKYTEAGEIALSLRRENGKVRLSVKDTGLGIKPEVAPNLFQKFTRAADASRVNVTGTGLGLFVAKQIVEAHHGKIWAESEGLGKGSTFIVEL